MLQLMNDVPANVVGVRAVGNVTKEDYEQVLLPAIENVVKEFGEINYLMVLETDIGNITYGAWMQDAKMSLKNFARWNRIAIVTDQKVVEKLSYVFNYLSPADAKGFPVSDFEIAKGWVSAPKDSLSHA
jgi:hypothetical protein